MLLLHLSDIHFRKGEIGTAMDPNAHLRAKLVSDAEERCKAIGRAPDAVLFSGDIAFGGDPDEYAFAIKWLDEICRRCGTTLAAVFTIPGNHDVARKVAGRQLIQTIHRDIKAASGVTLESLLRGLLTDPESARLLYEAIGPYNNQFASQFFCDLLPPERTIAKRDLPLDDGSILRLSGFNSAFVSSASDKPGDLFVDPACFQLQKEKGVEHLVTCHHPYSWLRQGDALKDFLNDVARIQLFGHEHTNRIELGRDWVRVAASAAHPDKTEAGWEPGYNLLELSVATDGSKRTLNVGVHVRVWQTRPGQFRAKMDGTNDVFRQKIELDDWTPPAPAEPLKNNVAIVADVEPMVVPETLRIDPMDSLRDISVRFFKLTLSQKSAIAGKLNLLEEDDANQPDFERFRRAFIRARERGLVEDLDREVQAATSAGR
jgi:DNA repair exonuclease SbcCD nuclease subunit